MAHRAVFMDSAKRGRLLGAERLKKENAELRREIARCKLKVEAAKIWAAKARFDELTREFMPELYKTGEEIIYASEKCGKCDEWRMVDAKLPSGTMTLDYCSCAKMTVFHSPKAYARYGLDSARPGLIAWNYYEYGCVEGRSHRVEVQDIYSGQAFETLDKSSVFFQRIEECQSYCDWLNEMEVLRYC
jgi:hypothetical protein